MRDVQAERGTGFERCLTARGVTAFLTVEWLGQDRQVITLGIVERDGGHRFLVHGEPRAVDGRAGVRSGASERFGESGRRLRLPYAYDEEYGFAIYHERPDFMVEREGLEPSTPAL